MKPRTLVGWKDKLLRCYWSLISRGQVGRKPTAVRGLCYIADSTPEGYLELPSYDEVTQDKQEFVEMFKLFYMNCGPISSPGLSQLQDTRYLVQNRPAASLTMAELDAIHELGFTGELHPFYARQGRVRARA